MMRRREFGLVGLSAAAAVAMRSTVLAQQPGARRETRAGGAGAARHDHLDRDYAMFDECAQACDECQRECDICSLHCTELLTQGKKEHAETLRTCQDCADICSAAARIVARKGPFSSDVCDGCAKACAKCGEACEKFADDPMMKACADACRACEEACREMIGHLGEGRGESSRRSR